MPVEMPKINLIVSKINLTVRHGILKCQGVLIVFFFPVHVYQLSNAISFCLVDVGGC